MLDWCRCVCKRAGQHQCFDSGSSAPIISPPAAKPPLPSASPARTSHPTLSPLLFSSCSSSSFPTTASFVRPALYLSISFRTRGPLPHPLSLSLSLSVRLSLSLSPSLTRNPSQPSVTIFGATVTFSAHESRCTTDTY